MDKKVSRRFFLGTGATTAAALVLPRTAQADGLDEKLTAAEEELKKKIDGFDAVAERKKAGLYINFDNGDSGATLEYAAINGHRLHPDYPIARMHTSQPINGLVVLGVRHQHGENAAFPLVTVANWVLPKEEHVYRDNVQLVPGFEDTPRSESRIHMSLLEKDSIQAPSEPGRYFLFVVGAAAVGIDYIVTGTKWDSGLQPDWRNDDKVTRWNERHALQAFKDGFVAAPEIVAEKDGKPELWLRGRYAAVAIQIDVEK